MVEKIFLGDDYSIFRHIPESLQSEIVVVNFDNIAGGLNEKGFGTDFLMKNGIENIYVSHKKGSFFQGLKEEDLKLHIGRFLKGKKVFTYGSSLGGYAALYYADVLKARAIAFSPRCSVDPIYDDAEKWGVTFLHQPLNKKVIERKSSPVIVIDPKVNQDLLFFEKRIEAAYGSYVHKVEMPYVNHGTAEAMLSQGLLKSFVLDIFYEGVVREFCFNPEDNCFSLSEMALDAAKKKKFDYANYCLARLAKLGGRPRGLTRLKAYQILIEHGSLRHVFSRGDIYSSEKRAVHRAHFKRVKSAEDQQSVLLSQFKMNMELLDYEDAKSMAFKIKSVYRVFEAKNQLIKKAEKHLAHSNSWIV